MVFDGREIIGKLRVLGPPRDSTALRLGLTTRFGNALLRPSSMPPSAILVVKKLTYSWPGPRWDGANLHDPRWERTVRASVLASWAGAARPRQGAVPENTEAVRFADEAELLACLSLDMLTGSTGKWVWQQVIRSLPSAACTGIYGLWKSKPTILPALIGYVHAWARLAPALSALSAEAALDLALDIATAFGVDTPALSIRDRRAKSRETGSGSIQPDPAAEPDSTGGGASPWDELPADLAKVTRRLPEQGVLAGVAWLIRHRPGRIRGRAYPDTITKRPRPMEFPMPDSVESISKPSENQRSSQEALAAPSSKPPENAPEWRSQDHGEPAHRFPEPNAAPRQTAASPPPSSAAPALGSASAGSGAFRSEAVKPKPGPLPSKPGHGEDKNGDAVHPDVPLFKPSIPPFATPTANSPDGFPRIAQAFSQPPEDVKTDSTRMTSEAAPARIVSDAAAVPDTQAAHAAAFDGSDAPAYPTEVSEREFPAGMHTNLAGIFYLINAMLEWQWVETMRAAGCGDGLGAWDWLELIARALLDGMDRMDDSAPAPAGADDPLWAALAGLAGRESGTLPYLAQSAVSEAGTGTDADAGTEILTVADAEAGVEAEPLSGPFTAMLSRDTRMMLVRLLPGLRARLSHPLPQGNLHDIVPVMLRMEGIVHTGATHVDVMLRMADIRIPVRFAGLDRNPGWAPEFGKVIYFHFD